MVTIAGGTVTATGGSEGAGIGGGRGAWGGDVSITGGTVTAEGGYEGAGIGGGYGEAGGTVTVSGGTVIANGGEYGGAGIGGGDGGSGGDVIITGGTVIATGERNSAGIGDGDGESAGSFSTDKNGNAVIFASGGNGNAAISDQSGKNSDWSGVIFENGVGKVYGSNVAPTEDFALPEGNKLEVPSRTTLTIGEGVTATVPEGAAVNNYGSIKGDGALDGDGVVYVVNGGSVSVADCSVKLLARSVTYVDEHGDKTRTADGIYVSVIESDSTSWGADDDAEHWYVVQGEVNIDKRVIVTGKVHLILADGASLKVNGGINVVGDNALSIYGQENGTGKLVANAEPESNSAGIGGNSDESAGTIIIAGGIVSAQGGGVGAGIGGGQFGSGGTVTISGGIVTAQGGDFGAGIGSGYGRPGGTITITGGTVNATGGTCGAGIGGGNEAAAGTITIEGGNVTATGGRAGSGAGDGGAGIGCGFGGSLGSVTITGGIVIARSDWYGAGIGTGAGGHDVTFSTGEDGHAVIFASGNGFSGAISDNDDKTSWSGVIFEGQSGQVYGNPTIEQSVTIPEGCTLDILADHTLTIPSDVTVDTEAGVIINVSGTGSIAGSGTLVGEGTLYLRSGGSVKDTIKNELSTVALLTGVEYVDANGTKTQTPKDVEVELLSGSSTAWGANDDADHWYVVRDDVTIDQRVTVTGKVHLILADGASLKVNGGINVAGDNALSVYGQQDGTGAFIANAGSELNSAGIGGGAYSSAGTIVVAGGTINATGGSNGGRRHRGW